jgi:hypothetical protein
MHVGSSTQSGAALVRWQHHVLPSQDKAGIGTHARPRLMRGPRSDLPDVRKSSKASSYFLSNFLAIIASRGGLAGADSRRPGIDPTLAQPGEKHDTGAANASSASRRVIIGRILTS